MPTKAGKRNVLRPSSDTSSVYTPEYTPASTPQPDGRKSADLGAINSSSNMGETAKAATSQASASTQPDEAAAKDDTQSDVQPAGDGASKDSKDVQTPASGATEHKSHVKCKKHSSSSKAKKPRKKCRRNASSVSDSSIDSSEDTGHDSDGSTSSESESDSDSAMDSDSSDSEEEQQRRRKKKSTKRARHAAKSSSSSSKKGKKNSRRKDDSSSDSSDAEDEASSESESEEDDSRRSKRGGSGSSKKRNNNNNNNNKKRRKEDPTPDPPASEEDNLAKAQEYLKSLGLKAKSLKATRKPAKEEASSSSSSSSESDRRSNKKSKRAKKDRDASSTKKGSGGKKATFFRGDELWDNENHQYEVKPTKSRTKRENAHDYVFTVKRKFDWEGKYEYTVVDIHARPLRDCLQRIMERCKSVSLAEDEPTLDPDTLFLYLEDMREYRKKLKASLKSGVKLKRKTRKAVETKAAQLRCMLKYLDKDYANTKATLYPMLKEGVITFDLLWTLFRSDTIVYTTTYKSEAEPRAFKAEFCTKEQSSKGVWYEISGKYFDFDGKDFGLGSVQTEIDSFQGVRKISSLACYPIDYHPTTEEVSKQLIERGKKFVDLAGMKYKFLKGMAFMKRRGQIIRINVNGRIMCDPATFRRINPNYPISNVKRKDPDLLSECSDDDDEEDDDQPAAKADACTCPDCLALDPNAFAQQRERDDRPKMRWKRVCQDKKNHRYEYVQVAVDDNGNEIRNPDHPQGNADRDLEALPRAKKTGDDNGSSDDDGYEDDDSKGRQDVFSDEELLIASPVLLGFAFSEKMWLELSVSGIQEIQWNEGAFDSLVLPPAQKSIVQALVTAHAAEVKADSRAEASGDSAGKIAGGHQNIDDVIQGKGKGLVAVLHGTPGTGKTLTAEGIAELRRCPLYCVSAGELGTNPRDLEAELTKILDVAHVWGAVLLLDEADVFLEARTPQDIHRNALVSIFLRLLEYFQGILFLTTNRVSSFDEAFQSRIHIALRYQELDYKARRKVWEMFLGRVRQLANSRLDDFGKDDLDKLARKVLNGRQIKNTVRSAQALALNEEKPLSMSQIEKVLEVAESFDRDLKGGTGYVDAMHSYT